MRKVKRQVTMGTLVSIMLIAGNPIKANAMAFINPIQKIKEISSPFGQNRGSYFHEGIDVTLPVGAPIYATTDGTVTKAAPDSKGVEAGGGHMIFVDHGYGIESRYMHLSMYMVEAGEKVKAGQIIGYSGESGDSTAPLLHYELRIDNVPTDPSFLFEILPIEDFGEVEETKDQEEDTLYIEQN